MTARRWLAAIAFLCALRLVLGAFLPLSADEAYYWLWSRHLAAGYYDHPPAIAYVIRAGTALFGDTPFGVRAGGILLSFAASWFVWRSAFLLLRDARAAWRACLYFNLTLMVTVEALAATPDAPALAAASAFFWALAELAESGRPWWWLAAGLAAGLTLLSKYTGFFLGAGALLWLIASPPMRPWLRSPWPYLGAALALLVFAPDLAWNAEHRWMSFAFQLGRVEARHFAPVHLAEFLGAQVVLATPFLFILGAGGFVSAARARSESRFLVAAMLCPAIVYFLVHALHARVQGNWPSFLYPLLSVAAAEAAAATWKAGWRERLCRVSRALAVPVASALLLAASAQALFGLVPMGRRDPMARLLAVGMDGVAKRIESLRAETHADAVLTTDYASAGWLRFYLPDVPVVAIGESYRWQAMPPAPAALYAAPALYVTEDRRDEAPRIARLFAHVERIARVARARRGVAIAHYTIYRVGGPLGAPPGKVP